MCGHSQHCGAHALSALHRRRLRRSLHRSLCASSRARVEAGSVCLCVCMCAQRVEAASGGSLRAFMHACECSHVRVCSCSYAVRACSLVCARNRCAPSRFIRDASRMRWRFGSSTVLSQSWPTSSVTPRERALPHSPHCGAYRSSVCICLHRRFRPCVDGPRPLRTRSAAHRFDCRATTQPDAPRTTRRARAHPVLK